MSNLVIDAEKITRVFPVPGGEFTALKGVDAKVEAGTFCILRGRSGSGKTTLMNIIGTLDDPTSGTVSIGGKPIKGMSTYDREELRRKELGFVFQSVSLIPSLNAFQNVEFSMRMAGIKPSKERDKRVEDCLRMVGQANRMNHMPAEKSGGEQQRVAIARSIAHSPKLILADEPTAELDSQMAAKVTEIFKEMTRKEGITVLMTTHDVGLMGAADEIIELENGERING